MLKLLLIMLASVATVACPAAAATFDPFVGPKPIAVLIDQDPWLMVIGSDTPRVAVYENGEVVFAKKVDSGHTYHTVNLAPAALAALEAEWLPLMNLKSLKRHYSLSDWTDQRTAFVYLRRGDRTVVTSAYGLGCANVGRQQFDKPPPKEVLESVRHLCALSFAQSQEWMPRYIEVMLWDYSYAPGPSTKWPADWPSLSSERARKRGDSYSIFLDGAQLPKLRAFLKAQQEKGAVELAGKKWAVGYRMTFPNEPMWRNAFSASVPGDPE